MDKLLHPPDVAGALLTPVATLAYWRHKGVGPAWFRIGKRVVYTEAAVQAWLEEQQAATAR